MIFLNYPVLDIPPNFDDPDLTTARDLTFSTRGFGQVTAWSIQPNAQRTVGLPYLLIGKDQILAFADFFDQLPGQAGLFWVPTYQNAMGLINDVAIGQTTLLCANTGLSAHLDEHPGYRYACLVSEESLQPFKINSVVDAMDPDQMTVTVAAASALAFSASQTRVSWLLLARLQTDEVALTYDTDELSSATLDLIEVPREYPA